MYLNNPYVGKGFSAEQASHPNCEANWDAYPWVCDTNAEVAELLALCPKHAATPLLEVNDFPGLAHSSVLTLKNETLRMGLGSFKALGAAFVIAQEAAKQEADQSAPWHQRLAGRTYVAASAGNHGLSVAAGARVFGAQAVIVLAQTVPASFAERLRSFGAETIIAGADYAASMEHAVKIAQERDAMLLSDSSWQGYLDPAWKVMQGYTQMAVETAQQMSSAPDTIYLQAGVGGLAAACAAVFRRVWGDEPTIIVVEPEAAPALLESIKQTKPVFADGPVSNMGRLDCKEPSLLALKSLASDADAFMTITDDQATEAAQRLAAETGLASTPSGVAGLAAAITRGQQAGQRVLCIVSEGAD